MRISSQTQDLGINENFQYLPLTRCRTYNLHCHYTHANGYGMRSHVFDGLGWRRCVDANSSVATSKWTAPGHSLKAPITTTFSRSCLGPRPTQVTRAKTKTRDRMSFTSNDSITYTIYIYIYIYICMLCMYYIYISFIHSLSGIIAEEGRSKQS